MEARRLWHYRDLQGRPHLAASQRLPKASPTTQNPYRLGRRSQGRGASILRSRICPGAGQATQRAPWRPAHGRQCRQCYEQVLVRLHGLGSLLYALGIVQNGVCHSGTPLVRYCTPLVRLIWLREGSDRVPLVCDSFTVLTATEVTLSFGG